MTGLIEEATLTKYTMYRCHEPSDKPHSYYLSIDY